MLNVPQEILMFHLFNKTYLHIDSFINGYEDRMVISETNGYPMFDLLEKVYTGTLLAYGTSVSEVVGPEKKYEKFLNLFEFCFDRNNETETRIVIYCDPEAFMEISSVWFKTIFVNIDSQSAYKILKAYFAKLILQGGRGEPHLNNQYREFLFSYEDFKVIFDRVEVTEAEASALLSKIVGFRSMEYLVASYTYNASHKQELKATVYKMLTRFVEEFLIEGWRTIQENILKEDFQTEFDLAYYNLDNILDMVNDPKLEALKSTNAWRALAGVGDYRKPLDMTTLTQSDVDLIKEQISFMDAHVGTESHPNFTRAMKYIDICHRGELTEEELDLLLDPEFHPIEDTRWWSIKDRENMNLYLLEMIFNERLKGRTSSLSPYLLK